MAKAKTTTRPWDITRYLESDEDIAALLAAALGDVARAKGMTAIARQTGLGRESLYKALSSGGNPEFGTVQKVVRSLGLRLHVTA
jgi:probable addiction module antidote protein